MGRRALLVVAGAVVGAAAGAALSSLQEPTYRADASLVLVREGRPPGSDPQLADAAQAAAALIESRAVADSVVANLRLDESPEELLDRVEVTAEPETSLVRVVADARGREEARRLVQAVSEVATVLYNDRFGPGTTASVWEAPAARNDPVAPGRALNVVLGALLGALLARLLVVRRAAPRPRPASTPEPAPEPEPMFVSRAPDKAVTVPDAPSTVAAAPEAEQPPVAVRAPERFAEPRLGEWTVRDVELLLAEQGPGFPDRADELQVYLDSFRDVVGPNGELPDGVEAIVEDVFAPLLERARSAKPA